MFKHLFFLTKHGSKLKKNVAMNGCIVRTNFTVMVYTVVLISLVACSSSAKKTDNKEADKDLGVMLTYNEIDEDKNTYLVNIFINSEYMHISNDYAKNDYVLFDRKKREIYNVNSEDNTIFVMKYREVTVKPPLEIHYETISKPSAAIPEVQGNRATHYRFEVNGKQCYDSVSMELTFMPDAVNAMKEFRNVLAGEHAKSVKSIPNDMLDACDLALNVFYPSKILEYGLPIREWNRKGYRRFLVLYKYDYKFPNEKLTLPEGYEKFSVGEGRKD